jgi:hypothetical protein
LLGFTYLIHFDQPYGHARHYIGWCRVLSWRMAHHRAGTGARLLQVVNEAGIGWRCVWVWPMTDRRFERRLKNRGGAAGICPRCGSKPPTGGKRPYRAFTNS